MPINEIRKINGSTKIAINFWLIILSLIKINNITIELILNKIPKNISIINNNILNLEKIIFFFVQLFFCLFLYYFLQLFFEKNFYLDLNF